MKTATIHPSKLAGEITRIMGDFNDARRNATHLKDFLEVGQNVRCCRSNGKWKPFTITKVGKRSFTVTDSDKRCTIDFIVTKYGQILDRDNANERFCYRMDIDFDCEKIDKRLAERERNAEPVAEAIEISRAVISEINNITPFNSSYSMRPDTLEKLKQIKAILGL